MILLREFRAHGIVSLFVWLDVADNEVLQFAGQAGECCDSIVLLLQAEDGCRVIHQPLLLMNQCFVQRR